MLQFHAFMDTQSISHVCLAILKTLTCHNVIKCDITTVMQNPSLITVAVRPSVSDLGPQPNWRVLRSTWRKTGGQEKDGLNLIVPSQSWWGKEDFFPVSGAWTDCRAKKRERERENERKRWGIILPECFAECLQINVSELCSVCVRVSLHTRWLWIGCRRIGEPLAWRWLHCKLCCPLAMMVKSLCVYRRRQLHVAKREVLLAGWMKGNGSIKATRGQSFYLLLRLVRCMQTVRQVCWSKTAWGNFREI